VLEAEARKKAAILEAEASKEAIVLKAEAERQSQELKAEATAKAMSIVTEALKTDSNAGEALQFLLAQNYLDMAQTIGSSESSKVMFMDPRNIVSTLEGVRSLVGDTNNSEDNSHALDLDLQQIKQRYPVE